MQLPQKNFLPKFSDKRGSLSFLESNVHLPFEIKSVRLVEPKGLTSFTLNLGIDFAVVSLSSNIVVHTLAGEMSSMNRLSYAGEVLIIPQSTRIMVEFDSNSSVLLLLSE